MKFSKFRGKYLILKTKVIKTQNPLLMPGKFPDYLTLFSSMPLGLFKVTVYVGDMLSGH